ncbi:MAG: CpsD/CapB family tyrosine-protein kinase [bacterium]|jgi:protein-tyrosine kinase
MNKRDGGSRDKLVSRFAPKSPVTEAYRILRMNLQFLSIDNPIRSVVVTGAGPQAGKTLTTANLGVVIAEAGTRVILVDGDLRNPSLHTVFSLKNEKGLTNVLIGECAVGEALCPTGVANLRLLTSGALPPNPAELLNSQRMRQTVDELKRRGDFILFDTPPVPAVADAALIAALVDGTVMVVAAGKTQPAQAEKAKEILENAKARLFGVVLNQVRSSGRDLAYAYY